MLSGRVIGVVLSSLAMYTVAGCACWECRSGETSEDAPAASAMPDDAATRSFRFVYGATITDLEPGATARVWLPVARSTAEQQVTLARVDVPGSYRETVEKTFGNRILYFEATADAKGEIPIVKEYVIQRSEVLSGFGEAVRAGERSLFLRPSGMVPVDGSMLKALMGEEPLKGDEVSKARALFNAILDRMTYDKPAGQPWGRGDARWACDARFGNCSDFHSVFIAACRDLKIPARFEIGFPIPTGQDAGEVGGYHCWAEFLSDGRWMAVDISEADQHPEMTDYYFCNLTPDRVMFTIGRDLVLDPPQQAGPVNFLVYPYVEVDGKPHTSFVKAFRYSDIR